MSPKLPDCSSHQVIGTLKRLGFQEKNRTPGSHLSMWKKVNDRTPVVVVIMGKKQIAPGTLKNILRQAEISPSDFLKNLKSA